jgi:DNA-binding NarL/FixJ family response regulator
MPLGHEHCSIIVADEERLMRWCVAQLARDCGCHALEAKDIHAVLALCHDTDVQVDLMLVDCPRALADLASIATLRRLRPHARLVLMTAFPSEAFARRAQTLGVEAVLAKPFDIEVIRGLLPPGHVTAGSDRHASFRFEPPQSLQRERQYLRRRLQDVAHEDGAVGEAARDIERALQEHVVREEQVALPALGLLPILATGFVSAEMGAAAALAADLHKDLPRMLEEHEEILAVVRRFEQVARHSGREDLTQFAERLIEHTEIEAEVLYPAAIVAGRFLEAVLSASH